MSIYVRNNTASTIPRGRTVYSDGVAGGLPRVALARADAVGTMPCMGITLEAIDPSQDGRIGTDETVTAMDTSAFALGDLLYVSAATAGALTATRPASPNIVQRVGRVMAVSARDGRMSIQVETANFANDGSFEIAGPAPELRFKETDQTPPAGEWRWKLSGDVMVLEYSATSGYATVRTVFSISKSAGNPQLSLSDITRLTYPAAMEIWHTSTGAEVHYTTNSNSSGIGYAFGAQNSASVRTKLLAFRNATNPGGTDNPYATFINFPVYFDVDIYGPAAEWLINAGPAASGSGQRMTFRVINDAGNVHLPVLKLIPNNADPLPVLRAPNITPTTTELDATFLFFRVNGSDQLVAYFNKAGAIISYVIGTLA